MSPVMKKKAEEEAQQPVMREKQQVITLMLHTSIDFFHGAAENMRTPPEGFYTTTEKADSAAKIAANLDQWYLKRPGVIQSRFTRLLESLG